MCIQSTDSEIGSKKCTAGSSSNIFVYFWLQRRIYKVCDVINRGSSKALAFWSRNFLFLVVPQYRFGYGDDIGQYPFRGGISHSDDLIYLFPYPLNVAKLNDKDTKIAKSMVDMWTSFAINGVPKLLPTHKNQRDVLRWEPFNGERNITLVISWNLLLYTSFFPFWIWRLERTILTYR